MKAGELDYVLCRHNPDAVAVFGYMRIIFSFILYVSLISTKVLLLHVFMRNV